MAVLKDLIVHGRSRFVNGIQTNTLNAESIGADMGIFNKLVATSLDAETATIDDLIATNAKIIGLLDVEGELHTNTWSNSNIATIGGSFYITPTIESESGTFTATSTTAITFSSPGTNFDWSNLYIGNSSGSQTTSWTDGSLVLITGEVLNSDGIYSPLGTLKGTINGTPSTNSISISGITDAHNNTSTVLSSIYSDKPTTTYQNLKISIYQRNASGTKYPLGIYMTAVGTNGKTFLDIYGGYGNAYTTTYGGLALPNLRIGNLQGLPEVGSVTPSGWGIYTSNGFFTGTVVATSGTIGGASISDGVLQIKNANIGEKLTANSVDVSGIITAGGIITDTLTGGLQNTDDFIYISTKDKSLSIDGESQDWKLVLGKSFGVTKAGYLKAISGKIGGWTIGTSDLHNGTNSMSSTTAGLYLGTTGIRNYQSSDAYVNITSGIITAIGANITGAINANSGSIGGTNGWKIETNKIYKGNIGTTDSLWLTTADVSSTTIADETGIEWRLVVGPNFGVKKSGVLYAKAAHITGAIKATSFTSETDDFKIEMNEGLKITSKTNDVASSYMVHGTSFTACLFEDGLIFYPNTSGTGTSVNLDFNGERLCFNKAPLLNSGVGIYATNSAADEGSLIGLTSSDHIVIGYGNALNDSFSKNFNMYTNNAAGNSFHMYLINPTNANDPVEVFGAGATSTAVGTRYLRAIGAYESAVATNYPLYVNSSGRIGKSSSSIRYKNSVVYLTNPENRTWEDPSLLSTEKVSENLADILKIPVVRYHYNKGHFDEDENYDYSRDEIGMIAEDVAAITPHCATYMKDDNGKNIPESWNEREFVPRILYVLQQQQKEIDRLKQLLENK